MAHPMKNNDHVLNVPIQSVRVELADLLAQLRNIDCNEARLYIHTNRIKVQTPDAGLRFAHATEFIDVHTMRSFVFTPVETYAVYYDINTGHIRVDEEMSQHCNERGMTSGTQR